MKRFFKRRLLRQGAMSRRRQAIVGFVLVLALGSCQKADRDGSRTPAEDLPGDLRRDLEAAAQHAAPIPPSASDRLDPMPSPTVVGKGSGSCGRAEGYKSLIANVWIGKELFLRTKCTYIGTIADISDNYRFPDGTTRDAVLVRFADGDSDWLPRKTLQQIYVTR